MKFKKSCAWLMKGAGSSTLQHSPRVECRVQLPILRAKRDSEGQAEA